MSITPSLLTPRFRAGIMPTARTPLLAVAAIIVVIDIVSTIVLDCGDWSDTIGFPQYLLTILLAIATLSMAWTPMCGALAVLIIRCAVACIPTLALTLSPAFVINVIAAMVVLAVQDSLVAAVAITLAGVGTACIATLTDTLHLDIEYGWALLFLSLAAIDIILLVAAAAQHRVRSERRQSERQRKADRAHTMIALHDDVANRLVSAALLLAGDGCPHDAMHDEIRRNVDEALASTRRLVSMLNEDTAVADAAASASTPTTADGIPQWLSQVQRVIRHETDRLEQLGLRGITLIPDTALHALADDRTALMVAFIRELCANIGKYADPDGGYVIAIREYADHIIITASDTSRAEADDAAGRSTGLGLTYYANALADIGGTMRVGESDRQWSLLAEIPV